jgi:hypothetical protein
MLKTCEPESFSLIINGIEVKTSVSEAVLVSPFIYESWRINPSERSFWIETDGIQSDDMKSFLDFFLGRSELGLSKESELKFLSCCTLLGNERLGLFILGAMHSDPVWDINSISAKGDASWAFPDLTVLVEWCASQLWAYSADELACLSNQMIHDLLSSPSLVIESEDALLDVLIRIGSETFEQWSYIDISFLSIDGLSLYCDSLPFDRLTSDIWTKVVLYPRMSPDEPVSRRFRFGMNVIGQSLILRTCPSPLQQFEKKTWQLLYRGTRDGFRSSHFHRNCDGSANTITVILTTNGCVFGGFTSVPWDSRGAFRRDMTPESFLFSVKSPSCSRPRIFPITDQEKAIIGHPSYGPIFGSGNDLCVSDGCDANKTSATRLGTSYRNDTGLNGMQVLAGACAFQVKEIEVFSVAL